MKNKVVVITGAAKGIGAAIKELFLSQGAIVCEIDILENDYFVGDISKKEVLQEFVNKVLQEHDKIDYLINNAMLTKGGIDNCEYDDFMYALSVGAAAPYYLSKLFKDHFNKNASIINISSTRYLMSQKNTESYTAAKGAITSLTHALAASLEGIARVNAIAPGWIDTINYPQTPADKLQHSVQRVGTPNDIAQLTYFLCSEKSSYINGQVIMIDGGMSKKMIYSGDEGWNLKL